MLTVMIFTAILGAALLFRIKRKELLLIIPALYPIALAIISVIAVAVLPQNAKLTCITTGRDEGIFVQLREENVLIDVSDGSYTRLRAIANVAQQAGVTEFDTVMLVLLPYPTTEDEAWIMVQIAEALQKAGVAVRVISPEEEVEIVDGVTLTCPRITRIERSAHPVTYLSFSDGEKRVTYLSASSWENGLHFENELVELASESDTVFIGAHGPVNKEIFDLRLDNAECVCIFGKELDNIICPGTTVPPTRTTVNAGIAVFDFGEEN